MQNFSNNSFPKVAIIILNWNGYQDTVECLKSLQKITYSNSEIIVVDNGSENDDYLKLKNEFSDLILIRSENNLGFTGGNNLGIKFALKNQADFVLLLNNDTLVEPNFIEPLLNLFDKFNDIGITAPQINYFNEPNKIWTSGGKINKLRGSGFAYSDKYDDGKSYENKNVTFVSGCCMLIRRSVLDKVGLFDDNFFLYVEDVDLCCRTIKAGYQILVSSNSKIFHKVSSSTIGSLSQLPLYYVTRNRLYFTKKNFPFSFFFTLVYISMTMLFKGFGWIIKGKGKNISVIRKAYFDYFNKRMGKINFN
jgi:GT2 family glycosyltransferase